MNLSRSAVVQVLAFVLCTTAATAVLVAAGLAEEHGGRQAADCLFCLPAGGR